MRAHSFAAAAALALAAGAALAQSPPPHAREGRPAWPVGIPAASPPAVFFLNLLDGERVRSPFLVEFGAIGLRIAPAGTEADGLSGHHHLIINGALSGEALREPLPADATHRHFGDGATRAWIELPPGEHVLRLVAADLNHVPHDPPIMSAPLRVIVVE